MAHVMERTWTAIGLGHNETEEQKTKLSAMFERVEWLPVPKAGEEPLSLPAMPGLAIKSAIQELRIHKVSHVAHSHEMAPYSLLAIRAHYKNGMAEVYLVDDGVGITPLASDFYPSEVWDLKVS